MIKKDDPYPSHPLGEIPIKIGRAFMQRAAPGSDRFTTVAQLSMVGGKGQHKETGTKINYSTSMGGSFMVAFERDGDSSEMKHQQTYTVDIHDLISALFELNERRRERGFNDAPPLEAP